MRFDDVLKKLESNELMKGFYKVDSSKAGERRIFLLNKDRKVLGLIDELGMSIWKAQVMSEWEAFEAFKEWFDREVIPF